VDGSIGRDRDAKKKLLQADSPVLPSRLQRLNSSWHAKDRRASRASRATQQGNPGHGHDTKARLGQWGAGQGGLDLDLHAF
jgi:hypothetical protein